MLPAEFHPLLRRWWEARFCRPEGGVLPPMQAQLDGWRAIRAGGDTLIAAPTGSGKTLAAFLVALDGLLREGLESGGLPDEVRVVYVSPLRALSADIHKNLAEPRREIRRLAEALGMPPVRITAAIRSGDTPQRERAAMLRTPPHVLVTTPESLYLLLTAERSRRMLATARIVIVDEIHALIESRRGAHLALSLERLDHVCGKKLQRIGLSATQRPIEDVARFLANARDGRCAIVDRGHLRDLDLQIELPGSPLEAVMSAEVWQEVYQRLVELIEQHRTTLVFVNTRRLAERMAFQLSERLGAAAVAAHHGSLAREVRLDAEARLREGRLRVLIATASLELGIDIGHVDLVCQISSPHRIATLLQRVGRSGHAVDALPKGRIFPLTRDDLIECAAMLRAVREGELDRLRLPQRPLDVLAQQIVAETAAEEWDAAALFELFRNAYPYRELERTEFDDVVAMLARGYSSRGGRGGALLHYDALSGRLRGRQGARMLAILSGGAIPEVFDYRVLLEPQGQFIGTLNEDFAIESLPGDIFQLGNTSWRILQIGNGVVRVADARGQPPSMPFWLGEAPARSDELSAAVSRLRAGAAALLPGPDAPRREDEREAAIAWLMEQYRLARPAAEQIATYLGEGKRALGEVPHGGAFVLERFFDEAGGMQLVLHAPLGSRVNKAWGLALRKKFCQRFNFELQAAANDEALVLSLGVSHSFPLEEAFGYLSAKTARETLVQAVLDSPIFETRWRWAATLALAVPRRRGGAPVPAQVQRMYAQELLATVFPDAAACLDNLRGARELPDHPLVNQVMRDCLEEALDAAGLERALRAVASGEVRCIARDTPEPSVLSHEILNSAVYTFLDDAPLEERRTRAVYTRRVSEPRSADDLGALDPDAIRRVRAEAWPTVGDVEDLHDALVLSGFILEAEAEPQWRPFLDALVASGRAFDIGGRWVAIERCAEFAAAIPLSRAPRIPARLHRQWTREDAVRELARSRAEVLGPFTAAQLAASFGFADTALVDRALAALEVEGRLLRGRFTPESRAAGAPIEWCDRRLLARIHRYTLGRLRAEIEPVSAAELLRFLLDWQHVSEERRVIGVQGLAAVIEQLDGYEAPAGAWETELLSARVRDYAPELLDRLCFSGQVTWGRLSPANGARAPLRSSPIALMLRANADVWRRGAAAPEEAELGASAQKVLAVLKARGALFAGELLAASGLLRSQLERALGELAGAGLVTADSFAGLRLLLAGARRTRRRGERADVSAAGRWSLLGSASTPDERDRTEKIARALLVRYGVVFRALLVRESRLPPWRDLAALYRRLEARGEIRGGRFVSGFGGEQFALPEAVGRMRALRKAEKTAEYVALSGADPLNLVGILTPEPKVAAIATNRILYRDGLPMAALEAGRLRRLAACDLDEAAVKALFWRRTDDTGLRLRPLSRASRRRWLERQQLLEASETKR